MTGAIFDTNSRVLVMAPHPDDESLAAGALLQYAHQAGAQIRILFMTNGENNPWPQRVLERRWRIRPEDKIRFGLLRKAEAQSAIETLGLDCACAQFLGFPDRGITHLLLTAAPQTIIPALVQNFEQFGPSHIVYPSGFDLHPDHNGLNVLVEMALRQSKNHPPSGMTYIVHRRKHRENTPATIILNATPSQIQIKRGAILCHTSQRTLRPWSLLARAKDTEEFLAVEKPRVYCPYHPVRDAQIQDDRLQAALALQPHPGAFGKPYLYLIGILGNGMVSAYKLLFDASPMPWSGISKVELVDLASNSVRGQGHYRGNFKSGLIEIDCEPIAQFQRVFIKLNRPFGFFDEAGWRELPIDPCKD